MRHTFTRALSAYFIVALALPAAVAPQASQASAPLKPVTMTLASSPNPSTFGQNVTLTATVTGAGGPSGTVTFVEGSVTLGSAVLSGAGNSKTASITINTLSVGSHGIVARYPGDDQFRLSNSPTRIQVVNPALATSSTTLASSLNPSALGDSVTFTATVSGTSPTGTVTFKDGATTIGSSSVVAGVATLTTSSLALGAHSMTAQYDGDASNAASTSSALTQNVVKKTSTTTLVSSLNPSVFGDSVTLTATVDGNGNLTGTVTFKEGATVLGSATLVGSGHPQDAVLTLSTLSAGSHAIVAEYSGDDNFAASASSTLTQVVNAPPAATTTSVVSSLHPSVFGDEVTFTATVTGETPTGTVTFKDGATTIGSSSLVGGVATLATATLTAGTHSITAVYGGDAENATSTSPALSQEVLPAITITTTSPLADGQVDVPYSLTFAAEGGSGGNEWTVVGGTLPLGFTLDNDGLLSGTTTEFGDFTFRVAVEDDTGHTTSEEFDLTIQRGANRDISIEKSGPAVSWRGATIEYEIVVTNNGTNAVNHVEVTDTPPTGFTYQSTGEEDPCEVIEEEGVVLCTENALPGGETVTFTLTFTVEETVGCGVESPDAVNSATVESNHEDPEPENNQDEVSTHILCSESDAADLAITKVGPMEAEPGATIEYTITVTNLAEETTVANVVVTDEVPEGLLFSSGKGCSEEEGVVTCALESFEEPITLSFFVTEDVSCGDTVINAASVTGDYELITSNNTSLAKTMMNCIPDSDLQVSKSGPTSVEFGQSITYTITVRNNGPDVARPVIVRDEFPVGLTFVGGGGEGCSLVEGAVQCITDLGDGEEESFTLTFTRVAEICTIDTVVNTATVSAENRDSNPSNNTSAPVTTQLTCPAGPPVENPSTTDQNPNVSNDKPSTHQGHRTNELFGFMNGQSRRFPRVPSGGFGGVPPGGFGGSSAAAFTDEQLNMICGVKKRFDRSQPEPTPALLEFAAAYIIEHQGMSPDVKDDILAIFSTASACY